MEKSKVIHLEKANTLSNVLTKEERKNIVSLKITGFMEADDFYGCYSITSIRVPASVKEMYGSSFACCNIEAYEVDDCNPYYTTIDGVVCSKDLQTLVAFPTYYPNKHYKVLPGTKIIGRGAFMSSRVNTVELPSRGLQPLNMKRLNAVTLIALIFLIV